MNTKDLFSNPPQPHAQQMFAQLPFEIVDHIVGELAFEDVRSIARVCSAFRLPAQIRLFRTIKVKDPSKGHIDRIESILSSPHLLQYPSNLLVHCNSHDSIQHPSIQLLWAHLPVMSRLIDVYISDPSGDYSRVLSALESLGSRREIALTFGVDLAPDLRISNNPLPIHTLELWVDTPNHQVATRLIQKCSQSLRYLRLNLQDGKTPPLPFLPHLSEFFAVDQKMRRGGTEPDLMSLSPFLDQHPTITRLILGSGFTLSRQPPPNLLPNLQYLEATPLIISRLIPGRPVNGIDAEYVGSAYSFPPDIMLQPFRQSFVPVTSLGIIADTDLPNDSIVDMVRSLPKLGKFTLLWYCNYEVRRLFEDRRYSELIGTRNLSPWKAY